MSTSSKPAPRFQLKHVKWIALLVFALAVVIANRVITLAPTSPGAKATKPETPAATVKVNPSNAAPAKPASASASAPASTIQVQVFGMIDRSGLTTLNAGSTLAQAIAAAGGTTAAAQRTKVRVTRTGPNDTKQNFIVDLTNAAGSQTIVLNGDVIIVPEQLVY